MGKVICILTTLFLIACNIKNAINYQNNKSYKIGPIEKYNEFLRLTTFEFKIDSMNNATNKLFDHRYEVDSHYLPELTKERKKQLYEIELDYSRRNFILNRSRYFTEILKNGKLHESSFIPDTISTECRCNVRNDTIQIAMGFSAFGGFYYLITITGNKYSASYHEDAYRSKPYKYHLNDSILLNEISIQLTKSELKLLRKPQFSLNELMEGKLTFTSCEYFEDQDYNYGIGDGEGINMDTMKILGYLYFKCELKAPPINKL